ncbi:Eco57I restriction-modification methylase domain-containing protein [Pseudanabaena sp. FACHB-1277]|uniref:site-specific DNA-methyltransferase (adenine-specific) n=2 Tax=Pseudanabaena TaxID=1152 RepID=A0A926URZ9_9CYAN|nr:Eco57I restriction-modification methylase domain-containing protein [Pseudanabaena cinerea FACHB-1277]
MVDDAAFRGGKSLDISQIKSDYDGIVIFGVTLKVREGGRDGGLLPTRSQLAEISRAFNREFCYTPVVVVFKYAGADGEYLAFANTERSKFKRNQEGEKAGKVTLLRDIDINNTHSGHKKILADLKIPNAGKDRVDSFDKLYKYWQKVLDVSLLNKQFYKEVSTWYFHACKQVFFPKDAKPDNQESLIRLITRLMFVWFLKEKGLVPDALFDKEDIQSILKSLEPQESTYYKAILQNLFFATLNTEGKREFIKESSGGRNSQHMVHNVFRYKDYFQESDQIIKKYFADIPFLNGGLFECLDVPSEKDKPDTAKRIDGFSNHPSNVLSVPNELFFGELQDVDLNADFGTSRKKYQVRGLIEIFKSYKFTIAENTPFEEDVALDPELLGQVFENLLAAYNPETQTTARKQTGSFYTPREIVNYMVDESLIAYLKNQLLKENVVFLEVGKRQTDIFGNEYKAGQLTIQEQLNQNPFKGKEAELEQKLRQLISFDDVNPFAGDEAVQERLIKALDNCKILDPACGSGAFPMGVLQKMVHILAKLDPHNERWRKQQKEKAIAPLLQDIQFAEKISYEEARDKAIAQLKERLAQIESSFENEMDYPRKLFLIQNCIYGVDIQPIALQIAKLRCFIALIVEQKVDDTKPNTNRGILPLPNLETKFVAANTLIGIEKNQQLSIFDTQEIQAKQVHLEKLRREHFFARSLATKRKKRDEDEQLCREIAEILLRNKFPNVDLLQNWKPYDQNASANFFDPEWMFGVADGFDIVIGNPPYVRQEQIKELKPTLQKQFSCYTGVADLFVYFFERGYQLLNTGGVLSYICSNKYFRSGYGEKLRDFLGKNTTIQQLVDFGDTDVFTAIAYPSIILFSKEKASKDARLKALSWKQTETLNEFPTVFDAQNFLMPQSALKADGWRLENTQVLDLLTKLRNAGKPLGEYVNGKFYRGILTGFNEAFVIDQATRDKLISEHPSSAEVIKPLLRGRDVKRWSLDYQDLWLIFTRRGTDIKKYPAIEKHLGQYKQQLTPSVGRKAGNYKWHDIQDNVAYWEEFEKPKIIYPNICKRNEFAWDESGYYTNQKAFIIPCNDKTLLAILNSSVMTFLFDKLLPKLQGDFYEPSSIFMKDFPIPTATEAEQKAIETLVGYVLHLTAALKDIPSNPTTLDQSVSDKRMNRYFEEIIDALVMELYLPEELHTHDKYFMRYILSENLPNLEIIQGDKTQELRQIFGRLFDKEHPIRHNLFLLNTIPVVHIIEGKS